MTTNIICPVYGYSIDTSEHLRDPDINPNPGDLTVCLNCSSVLVFTLGLGVKPVSEEVMSTMKTEDPDSYEYLQRVIKAIQVTVVDKGIDLSKKQYGIPLAIKSGSNCTQGGCDD